MATPGGQALSDSAINALIALVAAPVKVPANANVERDALWSHRNLAISGVLRALMAGK